MGFSFLHADKHHSSYKLALSFLMEMARHIQSSQNMKLVIIFHYVTLSYILYIMLYICIIGLRLGLGLWLDFF